MNFKTAAKEIEFSEPGSFLIGFNGNDETELDTSHTGPIAHAQNRVELWELWLDFCHENKVNANSIDYIMKGETV